jgi:UDP-N-acetylmuramoylalanine--D-glutamate ligase
MVPVRGFADRRVAVLGLKGPGLAAARALGAGGADVSVWDEGEPERSNARACGLTVEDLTQRDWGDLAAFIVEDAGLLTAEEPPRLIELARAVGAPVLAACGLLAEAAAREPDIKLALVTGRHAQAAADLARHLMDTAGLSVHDLLAPGQPRAGGWVIGALSGDELSSLPDIVEAEAFVALSPGACAGAGQGALSGIFERLADGAAHGLIATAEARPCARLIANRRGAHTAAISGRQVLGGGVYVSGGAVFDALGPKAVRVGAIAPFAPREAIAAGYALARRLGVDAEAAARALSDWPGAPGFGRRVLQFGPVSLVDWSTAHTPASAVDAVCGRAPSVWIAGPSLDSHAGDLLAEAGGTVRAVHLVTDRGRAARGLKKSAACTVHRTLAAAIAHAAHDGLKQGAGGCTLVYAPGSVSGESSQGFDAAANALLSRALKGDAA